MLDGLASARPESGADSAAAFVYFAEFARDDATKTSASVGTAADVLTRLNFREKSPVILV